MNNNFVVTIPSDLKKIESKLMFGLTKRQLIGLSITIAFSIPVFSVLKNVSIDIALYGLFFVSAPILFATIFKKDGMVTETWVRLYLEYKFLNPQKRYYGVSKKNRKLAEERKMINAKKKKIISRSSTAG